MQLGPNCDIGSTEGGRAWVFRMAWPSTSAPSRAELFQENQPYRPSVNHVDSSGGLLTAFAFSSGFLLISNILSTTFHHLKNKRARRRRHSPHIPACKREPEPLLFRPHCTDIPSTSFRSSALSGGPFFAQLIDDSQGSGTATTIGTAQSMDLSCRSNAVTHKLLRDETHSRTVSVGSRPSSPRPQPNQVDAKLRSQVRKFLDAHTDEYHAPSSDEESRLRIMRDAVAARYNHESTEPCSIAKKYLDSERIATRRCETASSHKPTYCSNRRRPYRTRQIPNAEAIADARSPRSEKCRQSPSLNIPVASRGSASSSPDDTSYIKASRTTRKGRFSCRDVQSRDIQVRLVKNPVLRMYRSRQLQDKEAHGLDAHLPAEEMSPEPWDYYGDRSPPLRSASSHRKSCTSSMAVQPEPLKPSWQ
ncbi:hypothetical protein KP509_08G016400 [Ceratopteris richardii]|uniref:Uncharacterized protein n=1 Tax=Ceratopteris richardii TaxID=49495 RepID=A0A8T2U4Y4_CERRI|nr:hypothetical protein KP509_08G016400 [Ceratopteris richardii]